jgi:uncharacterized repeat protein (TIGR03803 family)
MFGVSLRPQSAALAITLALLFLMFINLTAQAQTFKVLHYFEGPDESPQTGLTMDAAGNFYGTTHNIEGTVFKLEPSSTWVARNLTTLYRFAGGDDGSNPYARVAIARDGTLYGTTQEGGSDCNAGLGCGTVFHLMPAKSVRGSDETVLHRFFGSDGLFPQGDITFDQSGNIYGTTPSGGPFNGLYGVIYELTPSGRSWVETILYSPEGPEGALPQGGVIFDKSGNLYGVFGGGGPYGWGAVYELSPSGSNWTEQTLYDFTGGDDGENPVGGLITDPSGNFYGTTITGGSGGGGTVYKLTPAHGSWIFNVLYSFSAGRYPMCGPQDKLVMDAAGNLYGTTSCDGIYGRGSVFKLTPSADGWTYTSLHDFTGGGDGGYPLSNLVFDANGNLYGTASEDGNHYGVVFEITP